METFLVIPAAWSTHFEPQPKETLWPKVLSPNLT
jgi:hypothetical protein